MRRLAPAVAFAFAVSVAVSVAVVAPLLLAPAGGARASEAAPPVITVYKSPTCGCCTAWGDHMRANGFTVVETDTDALSRIKALAGVPDRLASCHTATVGGYVIEGHVPAGDVHRLLAEQPEAMGLAVPGMPASSPGMDVPGDTTPFATLLFRGDGDTEVFARH
jgi:hypothetical protein